MMMNEDDPKRAVRIPRSVYCKYNWNDAGSCEECINDMCIFNDGFDDGAYDEKMRLQEEAKGWQ